MFTGIIEETGYIEQIDRGSESASVRISAGLVLEGTNIGDSICVNGVCLTVTALGAGEFSADVMEETIKRSSLGDLKKGSRVNLERAMPINGRFGGHIVSGHIDGTGVISSIKKEEMAVLYEISADESLLRYIVEKGSVAIDGISLTVAKVSSNYFIVSIIPHTVLVTTLSEKRVSDTVNIETDIIGKYVEKLCGNENRRPSKLSDYNEGIKFLSENGF